MPRAISSYALLCALALAPAAQAAGPPSPVPLRSGWEIRDLGGAPAPPQPGPPAETQPDASRAAGRPLVRSRASQVGPWRPVRVPSVFSAEAHKALFGGTVKQYRIRFRAPRAAGFRWAFHFEGARRRTTVFLNGRRVGLSIDPYAPFTVPATGLRPGRVNILEATVDSRKDPRLPEGWWNWGGIVRPVSLVPIGKARVRDLGLLSEVRCKGPATRCRAELLVEGILDRLPREPPRRIRRGNRMVALPPPQPRLTVRLRAPGGRLTRKTFELFGARTGRRKVSLQMRVPRPALWSPERPQLYDARVRVTYKGATTQSERRAVGLRSVSVKRGFLYLNNRSVNLRGASIHEDFPGEGAALSGYAMDTTVRELKELGANITRAHYVLSEGLLRRLDRAGIMVWNQAPVWQRDSGANLLANPRDRLRALAQVERTVLAARSHPSVITHSVANELSFSPDRKPTTRAFELAAAERARELDPTLPISIDIKTRAYLGEQFTYKVFDMIGINQYFGWYIWNEDFALLELFLQQMRDNYPDKALVMTEFGAEGRPDMANAAPDVKGGYAFQAAHVARTMDVVDRSPLLSGAVHWTLREFEIFPGWRGGAVPGPGDNTRHHKGVLTYTGERKPAWQVLRDHFARTPLYR